jgi:hypothetical protein
MRQLMKALLVVAVILSAAELCVAQSKKIPVVVYLIPVPTESAEALPSRSKKPFEVHKFLPRRKRFQ